MWKYLKWVLLGLFATIIISPFVAIRVYNYRATANVEHRYRESGLIPASAHDLLIYTDQQWSFNGDGTTRFSFQCSASDFQNLLQICSITNALAVLDEPAQNTIKSQSVDTSPLMPTMTDTYYYKGTRLYPKPWYYYGQLIVLDPRLNRLWFFNIVT